MNRSAACLGFCLTLTGCWYADGPPSLQPNSVSGTWWTAMEIQGSCGVCDKCGKLSARNQGRAAVSPSGGRGEIPDDRCNHKYSHPPGCTVGSLHITCDLFTCV